jgi:hypothetical protein
MLLIEIAFAAERNKVGVYADSILGNGPTWLFQPWPRLTPYEFKAAHYPAWLMDATRQRI